MGKPVCSAFPVVVLVLGLGVCGGVVIVGNKFVPIDVAFAGRENVGSGILEHRGEERHDETLGVEVFHGFEDACALPFPAVERLLEVVSVALPQGDMPVKQSFCRCVEPIDGRDDGAVAAGDKLRCKIFSAGQC